MAVQHAVIIWLYVKHNTFVEYPEIFDQIGRMGALLFLFLVGTSAYLSYQRRKKDSFVSQQHHFFLRGLGIFGWGLVVSVVSFFLIPQKPIYFGVLHFIGTVVMLLPVFIKFKWLSRMMIFISLYAGALTPFFVDNSYLLMPFGIQPKPFYSLDYWPIFPWLAIVLTGMEVMRFLYHFSQTNFIFSSHMPNVLKPIQWLGSHTLLLYLLHAPILFILFWIINLLK